MEELPAGMGVSADSKMLNSMLEKTQNNEDLSIEEILFLYETERPIKVIRTGYQNYGYEDARVQALRSHRARHRQQLSEIYGEGRAHYLVYTEAEVGPEIKSYLRDGASVDDIAADILKPTNIHKNRLIDRHLGFFLENNVNPSLVNVNRLSRNTIINNLSVLIDRGFEVNVTKLLNETGHGTSLVNASTNFLKAGIGQEEILSHMGRGVVGSNVRKLLNNGFSHENILAHMTPAQIINDYDELKKLGFLIDVRSFVDKLQPHHIAHNLPKLLAEGADIDIEALVAKLDPSDTLRALSKLIQSGADIDLSTVIKRVRPRDVKKVRIWLMTAGINPSQYNQAMRESRNRRRARRPRRKSSI
jgi:hypothetical protein